MKLWRQQKKVLQIGLALHGQKAEATLVDDSPAKLSVYDLGTIESLSSLAALADFFKQLRQEPKIKGKPCKLHIALDDSYTEQQIQHYSTQLDQAAINATMSKTGYRHDFEILSSNNTKATQVVRVVYSKRSVIDVLAQLCQTSGFHLQSIEPTQDAAARAILHHSKQSVQSFLLLLASHFGMSVALINEKKILDVAQLAANAENTMTLLECQQRFNATHPACHAQQAIVMSTIPASTALTDPFLTIPCHQLHTMIQNSATPLALGAGLRGTSGDHYGH